MTDTFLFRSNIILRKQDLSDSTTHLLDTSLGKVEIITAGTWYYVIITMELENYDQSNNLLVYFAILRNKYERQLNVSLNR